MSSSASNNYLANELLADRAERTGLLRLIDETAATLIRARSGAVWEYAVPGRNRKATRQQGLAEVSASTNAMIVFALAATAGFPLAGPLAPKESQSRLGQQTCTALHTDKTKVSEALRAMLEGVTQTIAQRKLHSETYGPDDPFTLGWLAPIAALFGSESRYLENGLATCFARAWNDVQAQPWPIFDPQYGKALPHAFPLLRLVHLSEGAPGRELPPSRRQQCAQAFESTVHRQLANSTIEDASFDAAELIFAFEGLLRTAARPSEAFIDRFFEAVSSSQEHSPSWRPLRPFIGSDRGLVLLPLSVEGASSLARVCACLSSDGDRPSRFTDNIGLFRKYVQWLVSQRVQIEVTGQALWGWHSEHVREEGTIYTWQTSQVLIFLLHYVELLQEHMGRQALSAANLSIEHTPERGLDPGTSESWGAVWQTFLERPAQETQGTGRSSGASDESPTRTQNRSAVLYGPPGTGKTTLAEWLASALGWPLITVTPSDFMAEGPAAVEARAKALFTALAEQRRAVVVFDEIDRLILDRDRDEYQAQGDAFQLMTPSMLAKFNDLRRVGTVIFLVATNYVERIDSAITRPGRFDVHIAILPPTALERTAFLEREWAEKTGGEDVDLRKVGRSTWLATFAELKTLVRSSSSIEELLERVRELEPSISLESYAKRMESTARKPSEEVLGLATLCPPGSIQGPALQVVDAAQHDQQELSIRQETRTIAVEEDS